jgi:hypothetical protein
VDLAGYLVEPDAPEWSEFRNHYPECRDCSAAVAAWSRTEASIRAAAEDSTLRHTNAEVLEQFERSPESLPTDARQAVEAHLRACRSCSDQLAALREFDFSFLERSSPESPWTALKAVGASVGRSLSSLVPRRPAEGKGPWLGEGLRPSPEPAIAFQSREATEASRRDREAAVPIPVGVLVVTEGEGAGEVYGIQSGENRIGRSSECELWIPSASLARVEARIRAESGRFEVSSAHERRPVVVNGAPTQSGLLQDGDVVEVAGSRFRFRTVDPA